MEFLGNISMKFLVIEILLGLELWKNLDFLKNYNLSLFRKIVSEKGRFKFQTTIKLRKMQLRWPQKRGCHRTRGCSSA